MIDLNEFAKRVHYQNVDMGWWDNPDRSPYECLQLVVTEVAEATEGERKSSTDAHLPGRLSAEVELADTLLRVLDLGCHAGWRYVGPGAGRDADFNVVQTVAGQHLVIIFSVTKLAKALMRASNRVHVNFLYSQLVNAILYVADYSEYDVIEAAKEKLIYNRHRADHQRAVRAAAGGKKF